MRNSLIPSHFLVETVSKHKFSRRNALDIGCGDGRDTFFLLNNDFTVTAIDKNKASITEKMARFKDANLKVICDYAENVNLGSQEFDVVNAQAVLPFVDSRFISVLLENIHASLELGGYFVGQFFGVEDEWALTSQNITFHSEMDVRKLLSKFNIIKLVELKKYGFTQKNEPKFWHFFSFIAQKS